MCMFTVKHRCFDRFWYAERLLVHRESCKKTLQILNSKQVQCASNFVVDFGLILDAFWESKSKKISCKSRLIKQYENRCEKILEKSRGHLRVTPLPRIGRPNFRSWSLGGGWGGTTNYQYQDRRSNTLWPIPTERSFSKTYEPTNSE